jgi:hypothetical protein
VFYKLQFYWLFVACNKNKFLEFASLYQLLRLHSNYCVSFNCGGTCHCVISHCHNVCVVELMQLIQPELRFLLELETGAAQIAWFFIDFRKPVLSIRCFNLFCKDYRRPERWLQVFVVQCDCENTLNM